VFLRGLWFVGVGLSYTCGVWFRSGVCFVVGVVVIRCYWVGGVCGYWFSVFVVLVVLLGCWVV